MSIPSNITEVKRQVKSSIQESKEQASKAKEQVKVHNEDQLRDTPFDKGKFGAMLEEIILDFKQKRKYQEITLLKQPFEVEANSVNFFLNGELQEHLFSKLKPELMGIVKRKLENDYVEIHYKIREEAVKEEDKLYTSTDKLAYLTKKSPALKELQKRFGLETDF
ncbi:DNA polymerase III subunit gamma/tau [Echinicola marina]|uniref:DNA polymerase III subunit gamma/tau n=1 Tax=Echinicola marina TaxID=2859768 RepID=UPI001CF6BB6E|nr:DNA polymerase III subunit gamma/tau [Echinicola marina]UCS93515.1 DNA polymerase III subunit gamma/tau [Echinicola marina]